MNQPPFSAVTIIFNPNSTGPGERLARELADGLQAALPAEVPVVLEATERAGHASELAYAAALASPRPLVVSSSGDGGYHEVVNGLMRARQSGAAPTAGLLPAGNANDHFRALDRAEDGTVEAVAKLGRRQRLDLLGVSWDAQGQLVQHFAHSYVGLGLTPDVGAGLNATNLNRFNELWIALKGLLRNRGVAVVMDGRTARYDHVIMSNVPTMAKVLTLAPDARLDDGLFELTAVPRRGLANLVGSLLRAAAAVPQPPRRVTEVTFSTVRTTTIQLDGELLEVPARTQVRVSIEPAALECLG